MSTISELTVQVITARLAKRDMTLEELENEMQVISKHLMNIEAGTSVDSSAAETSAEEPAAKKVNFKQIFKKDEVICLICNKGFKTLKRHLSKAHGLKPGEYKKQFSIPAKYSLIATAYSEERKQAALDRGQGEILARARAARAARKAGSAKTKAPVPAKREKAAVPAVKVKAPVPAVARKAAAKPKK